MEITALILWASQQARIQSANNEAGDKFGSSVSLSSDGNIAIVGAQYEDFQNPPYQARTQAGAAYIFTRSGSNWIRRAKIQGDNLQQGARFGEVASISSDGNTVIIGSAGDTAGGGGAGAAYIFTGSSSSWTEQDKLLSNDIEAIDVFGDSVSISSDGNTVIIGAPFEDTGGDMAGSAYIFTRSGSNWTQRAKIQATDAEAGDLFGRPVSLASDGNTAIIGAKYEDTGGSSAGSAYIFTRSGSVWTQEAKIQSTDIEAGDQFGSSVSLSSDGNTAIIGAHFEDTGESNAGSAYIFTRSGSDWTQEAKIQSTDAKAGDRFGSLISMSADGNTAIIGAFYEDTGGSSAGSAYIFTRSGSVWTQQAQIQSNDIEAGDLFGWSVSISSDGTTAIIGAFGENSGAGAAYIFIQ